MDLLKRTGSDAFRNISRGNFASHNLDRLLIGTRDKQEICPLFRLITPDSSGIVEMEGMFRVREGTFDDAYY